MNQLNFSCYLVQIEQSTSQTELESRFVSSLLRSLSCRRRWSCKFRLTSGYHKKAKIYEKAKISYSKAVTDQLQQCISYCN